MVLLLPALVALAVAATAEAHMSIWTPSMYGMTNPNWQYNTENMENPVLPLGPGWTSQDDWWFRGAERRAWAPWGNATVLPAGGKVTLEIACHVAWTKYGARTTKPGSYGDACPTGAGAYHTMDNNQTYIDVSQVQGCALAIADVDEIGKVTWDNLVVFSVQQKCVQTKVTSWDVPAKMPACTGKKCICGWFWLASRGTANFYMTAFDCTVTGSPADATSIAAPVDPAFCALDSSKCVTGAKRPLYAYNYPSNTPWQGNQYRPNYSNGWSFKDGAQNDIFTKVKVTSTTSNSNAAAVAAASSSSAAAASSSSPAAASSSSAAAASSSAAAASASAAAASSSSAAAASSNAAASSSAAAAAASSSSAAAAAASASSSSAAAAAASSSSAAAAAKASSSSAAAAAASSSSAAAAAASSSSAAAAAASSSSAAAAASAAEKAKAASASSATANATNKKTQAKATPALTYKYPPTRNN